MSQQIDVVLGMNYGDEGKGQAVHRLVADSSSPARKVLVVRFNGGAQAGHTVFYDGQSHIFSHFGAGSLLGADTLLSEYMVLEPHRFKQELSLLHMRGSAPVPIIDPKCLVTTPIDIMINQLRSSGKTDTVGMGFGETIERSKYFPIYYSDRTDIVQYKLNEIFKEWVPYRIPGKEDKVNFWVEKFLDDFQYMKNASVFTWGATQKQYEHIVFEGAQGLLLDQDTGTRPYVTRSNTDLTNVLKLIRHWRMNGEYTTHLMSRYYLTRHGDGPLHGELGVTSLDPTNQTNGFQGQFRYAPLCAPVHQFTHTKGLVPHQTHIHLTCRQDVPTLFGEIADPERIKWFLDKNTECTVDDWTVDGVPRNN